MTQIQNQIVQFDYEAEQRHPTYLDYVDKKEYEEVENTEIGTEEDHNLYNGNNYNLFDLYEQERYAERNNELQEELSNLSI